MRRWFPLVFAMLLAVQMSPLQAQGPQKGCTAADFAAVVDQTGRALRSLNSRGERQFKDKLAALAKRKGWRKKDRDAKAASFLHDKRIGGFNSEIETLLGQFEGLGNTAGGKVDCNRLVKLKQVRDELLTVMGQKSGYLLAKLDAALAQPPAAAAKPPRARTPPAALRPPPDDGRTTPARPPVSGHTKPPNTAVATAPPTTGPWQTTPPQPGEAPIILPGAMPPEETFSINEIRTAGEGVFGTITAELAGVINALFRGLGRPNGYILGSEGSGAVLAGVRYGVGTLHLKDGRVIPVYWQGPSLGLDFGAAGSSTMFLVYNLKDPAKIFGRFTGVDGSAYLAGGVGATLLTNGGIVLAPMRTGIGLRLGASLTYLKFTEQQTWNPF